MLSSYVGEDKFLRGVSIYLKKNLFGSTRTQDLWNGISEATGLDVAELMDNWVVKMGFPVLTVTEADNGEGIIVHQDRFLDNGKPDDHDNETIWWVYMSTPTATRRLFMTTSDVCRNIPLSIITSQNGRPVVDNHALLREREKFFSFDTSKPFKLNAGTTGFCVLTSPSQVCSATELTINRLDRVLYTPERLRQLGLEAAKKDSILSLDDKLGLLLDAMAVAKAGLASLSGALDFAKQLKDATECLSLSLMVDLLLMGLLKQTPYGKVLQITSAPWFWTGGSIQILLTGSMLSAVYVSIHITRHCISLTGPSRYSFLWWTG